MESGGALIRDEASGSFLRWSEWKDHEIVQTLRPHYWYGVLINCHNSTLRQAPVHFDIVFKNDIENESSHFSADDGGMYSWTLLIFAVCNVVGFFVARRLRRHYRKSRRLLGHFHPVVSALLLALILYYLSLVFQLCHYVAYGSNGYGWSFPPFQLLGTLLQEASKLILTSLFIVISQGWTITKDEIPNRKVLLPILAAVGGAELLGTIVQGMYADSHDAYSSRAREGVTGFVLIAIQLAVYYWFLTGVRAVLRSMDPETDKRSGFFLAFALCSSLWFLTEPFLLLLSVLFANYYRQRLLIGGSLLIQTTALFLLSRLFLWRGLYFKISNLGESVLPGGRGSTGARAKDI